MQGRCSGVAGSCGLGGVAEFCDALAGRSRPVDVLFVDGIRDPPMRLKGGGGGGGVPVKLEEAGSGVSHGLPCGVSRPITCVVRGGAWAGPSA